MVKFSAESVIEIDTREACNMVKEYFKKSEKQDSQNKWMRNMKNESK